jgi:hypothetical protein
MKPSADKTPMYSGSVEFDAIAPPFPIATPTPGAAEYAVYNEKYVETLLLVRIRFYILRLAEGYHIYYDQQPFYNAVILVPAKDIEGADPTLLLAFPVQTPLQVTLHAILESIQVFVVSRRRLIRKLMQFLGQPILVLRFKAYLA